MSVKGSNGTGEPRRRGRPEGRARLGCRRRERLRPDQRHGARRPVRRRPGGRRRHHRHGSGRRERRPAAPAAPPRRRRGRTTPARSGSRPAWRSRVEADEAARLAVTVAQLEHALAARVRVEQAIGVLAERHRLRPREAFDLLRKASRARGARVTELAQDVVASTANPLLRLPDELSRAAPEPRQRRPLAAAAATRGRHAAGLSPQTAASTALAIACWPRAFGWNGRASEPGTRPSTSLTDSGWQKSCPMVGV